MSKFLRLAGAQGDFFFFSQRRLEAVAREVCDRCRADAGLDFFHGFTPWVLTKPRRPYIAWGDCTFRDYINIYHGCEQFRKDDIKRIERAEAAWLTDARHIIFTSDWAAEAIGKLFAAHKHVVPELDALIFREIEMSDGANIALEELTACGELHAIERVG